GQVLFQGLEKSGCQIGRVTMFPVGLFVAAVEKSQRVLIDFISLPPLKAYSGLLAAFSILFEFFPFLLIQAGQEIIQAGIALVRPMKLHVIAKKKTRFLERVVLVFGWK